MPDETPLTPEMPALGSNLITCTRQDFLSITDPAWWLSNSWPYPVTNNFLNGIYNDVLKPIALGDTVWGWIKNLIADMPWTSWEGPEDVADALEAAAESGGYVAWAIAP